MLILISYISVVPNNIFINVREKKRKEYIYKKKNPFFFFFFNFNFILNLLTKKNGFNLRIQTVVLEKFQYKF
jgi:hypothetical protein